MAVVQISKIQIRRGQKNVSGLPQLASGELAWAIDTQELFIGNGAVSEGAPAVGNTKVLTELDNILDLASFYTYEEDDPRIQTGPTVSDPINRSLRNKLDDIVNAKDFGVTADGVTDDADALQRAIIQLYVNESTKGRPDFRRIIQLPAGEIRLTKKIFIPPFTALVGNGYQHTIIKFETNSVGFEFVNETITADGYDVYDTELRPSTSYLNQCRNILFKDFSISTQSTIRPTLRLYEVRDSVFENIQILGSGTLNYSVSPPTDTFGTSSDFCALDLHASVSSQLDEDWITTSNVQFKNCSISGFHTAVRARYDVVGITFDLCEFSNCRQGIMLGLGSNGTDEGQQVGPSQCQIRGSRFSNIVRTAVDITRGSGNVISSNRFYRCGDQGSNSGAARYNVINVTDGNNTVKENWFERTRNLMPTQGEYTSTAYVPEIGGHYTHTNMVQQVFAIGEQTTATNIFKLPLPASGTTQVNYLYVSTASPTSDTRQGKLTLTYNSLRNQLLISDEYDFVGDSARELNLEFFATISSGTPFGAGSPINYITISYTNSTTLDVGQLYVTYTSQF